MSVKPCLECGELVRGRADKKFCSDPCRNAYNNRQNKDVTNYMRNVNNILRRNRRTLVALNPAGKTQVSRQDLVAHSFNFEFYTSTFTNNQGGTYFYCYEQGYLALDEDTFLLVRKRKVD